MPDGGLDVGGLEPLVDRVGQRDRGVGAALAVDLSLQACHDFLRLAGCGFVGALDRLSEELCRPIIGSMPA